MDGERFDRVARAWGARGSRRAALGLLAGSALAGLFLRLGNEEAAAGCTKTPVDKACAKDGDCCSNECGCAGDKCTCREKTCKATGAKCGATKDCCEGPCGQPKSGDRTCRSKACNGKYAKCSATSDCCDGDCRFQYGWSRSKICFPSNCANAGGACGPSAADKQCCGGHCASDADSSGVGKRTCRKPDCKAQGASCAKVSDCCEGRCGCRGAACTCRKLHCRLTGTGCLGVEDSYCCEGACGYSKPDSNPTPSYTCRRAACRDLGGPCADRYDCCEGECGCTNGTCTCRRPVCSTSGSVCSASTDCCEGPCAGGTCRKATCQTYGQSCVTNEDCCDGYCQDPFKTCQPLSNR